MKFPSKNLLVTGGSGFIGSNFIIYLLDKYDDVKIINLDALTYAANINNLVTIENNKNYKFISGSICNKKLVEKLFLDHKIDGVINFAAETHVDNSIINPEIFIRSNISGVFNLLNIAYKFWMNNPFETKKAFKYSRFHQISTDEIYGSIDQGSFSEKSNYAPNSPYSASKASADMLVRSFNKTYGLNTTISISSNNYGKYQHDEKFIPKVIKCLLNGTDIPVYGSGTNIRDWLLVEDHCKAIEIIFSQSKSGSRYNIAGKNEFSNLQIIDIIHNIINKIKKVDKKIKFVKDRYGHDKRYSLNICKIKNNLAWYPNSNFEKSITTYIKNKIDYEEL